MFVWNRNLCRGLESNQNVCMYVCMYVFMCECMYVYVCVCVCLRVGMKYLDVDVDDGVEGSDSIFFIIIFGSFISFTVGRVLFLLLMLNA